MENKQWNISYWLCTKIWRTLNQPQWLLLIIIILLPPPILGREQTSSILHSNPHTSYTGMTSIFDASSHLNTMPSRLAGRIHLAHWHPVVNGSGGGTIISTLSFLWTTPITLTVLPSLMYLPKAQIAIKKVNNTLQGKTKRTWCIQPKTLYCKKILMA